MIMETKVCKKCGRELTVSEFYKNPHSSDGLHSYCKVCAVKGVMESRRKRAQSGKAETKEQKPVEQPKHKVYTNPVLAPITPRELMLELKARGYEGELVFKEIKVTVHRINLSRLD